MAEPTFSDDPDAFLSARDVAVGANIDSIERGSKRLQAVAAAAEQSRIGWTRLIVSVVIISIYGFVVVGAFVYVIADFPECTSAEVCKAQFDALRDLITTAVVPVVTLMLGFYFGTEAAKKNAPEGE